MAGVTAPSTPTGARAQRGRRAQRVSGDERERAILATFERLLEERPLHEISIDDLARGAGISRPSFYFYFPSKEAVLLTLLDRIVAEARGDRGELLDRVGDAPEEVLRDTITAIYETFDSHRALTVAAAEAQATSPAVRELWSRVMERWVAESTAAIEAERARGAAPPGVPARDLATSLNLMNERVFLAGFAGYPPTVPDKGVIDALVAVWLGAIYGANPAGAG